MKGMEVTVINVRKESIKLMQEIILVYLVRQVRLMQIEGWEYANSVPII
jgi:hypothetical protein